MQPCGLPVLCLLGIRYDGVFLQQSTFFLSSLQQWKCIGPRRFERGAAIPKLRHVSGMLEWQKSGKPLGIIKLAKELRRKEGMEFKQDTRQGYPRVRGFRLGTPVGCVNNTREASLDCADVEFFFLGTTCQHGMLAGQPKARSAPAESKAR